MSKSASVFSGLLAQSVGERERAGVVNQRELQLLFCLLAITYFVAEFDVATLIIPVKLK